MFKTVSGRLSALLPFQGSALLNPVTADESEHSASATRPFIEYDAQRCSAHLLCSGITFTQEDQLVAFLRAGAWQRVCTELEAFHDDGFALECLQTAQLTYHVMFAHQMRGRPPGEGPGPVRPSPRIARPLSSLDGM